MARILYGKEVSSALWERLLPRIDRLRAHGVAPTLAIVRVGERPDDLSYERERGLDASRFERLDATAQINRHMIDDWFSFEKR